MMQTQFIHSSWSYHNLMDSNLNQAGLYSLSSHMSDDHGLSSFTSSKESSRIVSDTYCPTAMFSDEFMEFPVLGDEMEKFLPEERISAQQLVGLEIEPILNGEIEDMCKWLEETSDVEGLTNSQPSMSMELEGDVWSACFSTKCSEASVALLSLTLPGDDKEIDAQLSIHHLLKAYGEAMEMDQRELAGVIVKCINEKVSPVGETIERVAFNLFQSRESQGVYLKQESSKNFRAAFKAFYQIFPYGRFAHFAANLAIFESMPYDAETIHIVDFEMGEGIQWPSLIETMATRQQRQLKLTSVKQEEEEEEDNCCCCVPSQWRFDETKSRLADHAKIYGLKLIVEEVSIDEFLTNAKKLKNRGFEKEWVAFNCMVGLPHMGRRRCRKHAMEFLGAAKELLVANSAAANRGIITFGDGEAMERQLTSLGTGYAAVFEGHVRHYQALFESIDWNFPDYLAEARLAMQSLFAAPFICSNSWFQKWEWDVTRRDFDVNGLEGSRLSKHNLMEAKTMVREGESSYAVKLEGDSGNEMVLEWRGTPLVRISTWN